MNRVSVLTAIVLAALLAVSPAGAAGNAPPVRSAAQLERESQLQRATQAVIWGVPAASMMALRRGVERDLGGTFNDVIFMSQPMVARHAFLTANNQTPYVMAMLDTTPGPVVVEVPPASPHAVFFGTAIDAWQVPIADMGPQGDDAGRGGKYLFLPPGYDQPVPEGYLVNRPATHHIYVALRPVAVGAGKLADAVDYSKRLRVYPLAMAANPVPNRYIDAFPRTWDTLHQYDLSFFKDIARMVAEEPTQPKDMVMMGMLATLGISRDKPFVPNAAMAELLGEAAELAGQMLQADFFTPGKATLPFWPDTQWGSFNLSSTQVALGFPFTDANQVLLDQRAQLWHWATFAPKKLGRGTFYLTSMRDGSGRLLDGRNTYRLRLPAGVPVSQFWSVIAYSTQTKSFIAGAARVGISSYDKSDLKFNADGSIDLYFGPTSSGVPMGMEANWLPTGEDFFLMFRFYGPQPELFQKTWRMPDLELNS